MKKSIILIGTGLLISSAVLPVNGAPAIAQAWQAGQQVAQNMLRQPKVNLQLSAERQVIQTQADGKPIQRWLPVDNKIKAKSGDVLRFVVVGKNEGDRAAQNFVLTQPIPRGTKFVSNTADSSIASTVTYSIDQGKTFTTQPKLKITQPNGQVIEQVAPVEAYTHARWQFNQSLQPLNSISASYQVAVR
jgi:uncharacterized repeat protein (TIGR01451 family)